MSGNDWRRILVLASAVGFFEALLFSVLAPLLPDFEEGLGLSKASAGLLTSAYAAGAFIGALPSIWAARRFGVKATVVAGLILLAVSSAAFTVPESAWLVFAARVGQGAGSAFAYTGALAWLAAVAATRETGRAYRRDLCGHLLGGARRPAPRGSRRLGRIDTRVLPRYGARRPRRCGRGRDPGASGYRASPRALASRTHGAIESSSSQPG